MPKSPLLYRLNHFYSYITPILQVSQCCSDVMRLTLGPVPEPAEAQYVDEKDEYGNIDLPPEYGIDITIRAGTVNYGPWSDRQRDALQKTFAPSIFFDSEPKPRLRPGDTRVHSNLVVNVQFEDRTTLRIPTREPSKVSDDAEQGLTIRIGSTNIKAKKKSVDTVGSMLSSDRILPLCIRSPSLRLREAMMPFSLFT